MNFKRVERDKRILNITHYDADGIASHIALKNYYKDVGLIRLSYNVIDRYVNDIGELKDEIVSNNDHIYITDISLNLNQYNKIKAIGLPVTYIDHHESYKEEMHCPKENRIVMTEKCGAYLTKAYLEAKFNVDLSHLNLFMKLINDYDLWHHELILSKPFQYVFDYYFKNKRIDSGNCARFIKPASFNAWIYE
jgi:oligoribonuclease NrnB/cAMP/cGMP phosphodiesterase (DHH superfamily)